MLGATPIPTRPQIRRPVLFRPTLYPWLLDTARVARSSVHARRLPKTVLTQVPGASHTLHPM